MKSKRLSIAKDIKASLGLIKSLLDDAKNDASRCLNSAKENSQPLKIQMMIENEEYIWLGMAKDIAKVEADCEDILEGRL